MGDPVRSAASAKLTTLPRLAPKSKPTSYRAHALDSSASKEQRTAKHDTRRCALLEGVTYGETTRWPEGFEPPPPSPPGPVWDPETNLQAWLTNRRQRTHSQEQPAAGDDHAER
jgi:hypothetical protein